MRELKKKVIVIEESPYGSNIFESVAEELKEIGQTTFHFKKNPNKTTVFQAVNKWKESLNIVHYDGNDFLNVFIDGGVHHMRFILSKEQLERLVSTCTNYVTRLEKVSEEKRIA